MSDILPSTNLRLEHLKLALDLAKWAIGGTVLIVGFLMIRPHEQDRADLELQRQVFSGYVDAKDDDDIDHWQRKLNLVSALADDSQKIVMFIESEQKAIDEVRAKRNESAASAEKIANLEAKLTDTDKKRQELEAQITKLAPEAQDAEGLREQLKAMDLKYRDLQKDLDSQKAAGERSKTALEQLGVSQLSGKSEPDWETIGFYRRSGVKSEAAKERLQQVLDQFVSYIQSGEQCYVESEKEGLLERARKMKTVDEQQRVLGEFVDLLARYPDCQNLTPLSIILEGASEFVPVESAREKLGIQSP